MHRSRRPHAPRTGSRPRVAGWALPALLALALGTFGIGAKSLWGDETFSVTASRLRWPELWHLLAGQEANMGLHFALLHALSRFGSSDIAVRAPSTVFTVATVPLVWLLADRLIGRRAAPVAAFLVAASPFVLSYAQEARGYALAMLLAVAATLRLVRAVDAPTTGNWLLYGVVGALALDGHLYFAFVLVVHVIALAIRGFHTVPPRRWIAGSAVLCALALPLVIATARAGGDQIDWIQRPSLHSLGPSLEVILGGGAALCAAWLVLAVAAVASWSAGWRRIERWSAWLVVAWGTLPVAVSFGISLWRPIFVERYLIVAFPGLALLAAAGVAALPGAWHRVTATTGIALLLVPGLVGWLDGPPREDWRRAAAYVAAASAPGDGIAVVPPAQRIALEHYDGDLGRRLTAVFPGTGQNLLNGYLFDPPALQVGEATTTARASRRVWLVVSPEAPGPLKDQEVRALLEILASDGFVATGRRSFAGMYGSIDVSLFERVPVAVPTAGGRPPGEATAAADRHAAALPSARLTG